MSLELRCRCGALTGRVATTHLLTRAICYCKDCQAFARYLGRQDDVLDAGGGTDILAMQPRSVRFTAGVDRLACLSLSAKGLLRWYAGCCNTPLANTPRNRNVAYAGLLRSALAESDESVDRAFGPAKLVLFPESATGPVKSKSGTMFPAMLRIMGNIVTARLGGSYRDTPFFDGDGTPLRSPRLLAATDGR
jgi:hypothetical protein